MTQVNITHSISPLPLLRQVSLFDANDRLLNDADLLRSLTKTPSSTHIPVRFTLINTITSFAHCPCSSSSSAIEQKPSTSSSPSIIQRGTIDQTLSTCSFIPPPPTAASSSIYSPCLSSSSPSNDSSSTTTSISIVNLLTPPSSHSSLVMETLVDSNQSMIDEITSEFGEICPPLVARAKKSRSRVSKKMVLSNVPLDLSLKKRPSSTYDLYSSQSKWIKT